MSQFFLGFRLYTCKIHAPKLPPTPPPPNLEGPKFNDVWLLLGGVPWAWALGRVVCFSPT